MPARASQIRAYRFLGCLAVVHSSVVLVLVFRKSDLPPWWLGFATSLILWLLVLAIHPGRSIRRFLTPTIIAAALFIPCAPLYGFLIQSFTWQWRAAHKLEKLLRSNPKMVLYSIDADYRGQLEVKKGYRRVGMDELIFPDDLCDNCEESLVRMDQVSRSLSPSIAATVGHTVNSIADAHRSDYGCDWQILRKEMNGSTEAESEAPSVPQPEFDREPYKGRAVLGYVEITDRAEQRALITALASSARHSQSTFLCHEPRHGLYVETSTFAVNLSICFECQNVYPFSHDKIDPFADLPSFAITKAPASLFNATLKRHGVQVPLGPAR